jgi:tyrosinase
MSTQQGLGVRVSITELQNDYDQGKKQPLEDLVRAWKGIQELPPGDVNSFFVLGGYHGEPFTSRPAVDALSPVDTYDYWGGFCNHGNVLFPSWHRLYLWRLEQALQSVVPGVMMPFWDETADESLKNGIPSILTQETFELDGQTIRNPLRSYVLPERVEDDFWQDNIHGERNPYFKPPGYETVRYPLSGLVGNTVDREATRAHNDHYPDPAQNTAKLNRNIGAWLNGGDPTPKDPNPKGGSVFDKFRKCLSAPNYTVFSNTTSATAWTNQTGSKVEPLEDPHNDIHLSVGGFDAPALGGPKSTTGRVAGANGDMGENNTAGFDPIFFFHHCNIDRMFWLWQKLHGCTTAFDVIEGYAGTNSSDSQGPTPGIAPGTPLSLKTPLNPFFNVAENRAFTTKDCIDIKKLGYTYGPGSFETPPPVVADAAARRPRILTVRGIDRADFQGSFVLTAYGTVEDASGNSTVYYLGHHSVLSRWDVSKCANCRTHLEVIAHFPLTEMPSEAIDQATFTVEVQHRGKVFPEEFTYEVSVSSS